MGRSPCCEKVGLKKGPWTPEEDQKLMAYIEQHGHGSWRALPSKAGLQRCGKSCRLRWTNYLRPDIKRGKFSLEEERTIIQLHALLGNRWSVIASHLAKRTDNEIKNYWNTHLKKRLTKMGIDPTTHKPKLHALGSAASSHPSKDAANLSHMAQWESARLQAEARLVKESQLQLGSPSSPHPVRLVLNKIPAQPSLPPCLDVLKAWQNSRSSPTANDKNNVPMQHNTYALMLAAADDALESPTSTLTFMDTLLPPPPICAIADGPTHDKYKYNILPPATTTTALNSDIASDAGAVVRSWGCLSQEEGERRMMRTGLEDDDIMVAVEAFMGDRYKKNNYVVEAEVLSSCSNSVTVMEGLSLINEDNAVGVVAHDSNENENVAAGEEDSFEFIDNGDDIWKHVCGGENFLLNQ